jgi:uncharacterized protein YbaA (DUF1428 family)
MAYVDGFVIPIPKTKVEEYRKMASKAGKVWMEYGAQEYRECLADELLVTDPQGNKVSPFPVMLNLTDDETALFSWIVYKSKAERDRVNKKVLTDPRIAGMDPNAMPFDSKRMAYAGFKTIVDMSGNGKKKKTTTRKATGKRTPTRKAARRTKKR